MNILIIGNGFDIAHGLPTKYEEFLKFTDQFIDWKNLQDNNMNRGFGDDEDTTFIPYLCNLYNQRYMDERSRTTIKELTECIIDNLWLAYFKQVHIKENWIDFEREISRIIRILDNVRKKVFSELEKGGRDVTVTNYELSELKAVIPNFKDCVSGDDLKEYKKRLIDDLNKLIRCLEIYLSDYINNREVIKAITFLDKLMINKVLSFNYTNTYERVYGIENTLKTEYDFIHGKASLLNTTESCNMVVGIDEYLKGDEKNTDNEFIQFKKFFQRIYKGTGDKYVGWLESLKSLPASYNLREFNVYILGHSLDDTDGDVLRKIILYPGAKTTIFYHSKAAFEKQIANLVKVISEDELIHRTSSADKAIRFRDLNNVRIEDNEVV